MFKKTKTAVVVFLGVMLGFFVSSAQAEEMLMMMQENPKDWVMQLGNYSGQRYSELKEVNASNVDDLNVSWTFSTGLLRGHEGGPLVVGDTMWIHTPFPHKVFSLDLKEPGTVNWEYESTYNVDMSKVPEGATAAGNMEAYISYRMCCDHVNRGVAYSDGMIYLYQADTQLVALDANTGKKMWAVNNGDVTNGETGTSAPVVYDGKVYVGISGGELGVIGHLTAYDAKTGKMLWRGKSVGPDSDTLLTPETTHLGKAVGKDSSITEESWGKGEESWKLGGGTTWGWYTVDPDLNLIYYGSGNPGTWNPSVRPGSNRWSMTIFARDLDTGEAKWVYQMTPHDEWDFDGVNEMVLADIKIKGKERKILAHFDRNGFGYTLDRETGELLVAEKFDPAVNWSTGVDMKTGVPEVVSKYSTHQNGEDVVTKDVCPAALGTKDQQPSSFSRRTGLFYVPTNHVCMTYEPFYVDYTKGEYYVGANLTMFPAPGGTHMGNLIAWDAAKGKIVQSKPERFSVWSGVLSTAGGIVCYGTLEGYMKCVDDKNINKELYSFKTPSGIIGNVNTYEQDGKQYIAVLSGLGGWAGIGMAAGLTEPTAGLGAVGGYKHLENYTRLGGVLTVFSL